jgi:hypothetical protein
VSSRPQGQQRDRFQKDDLRYSSRTLRFIFNRSSPPGPTTQSWRMGVSEHPRFSAVWGGCNGPFAVSAGNEDRPEADWGPSSLTSEIRFPVRGEGRAASYDYRLFI